MKIETKIKRFIHKYFYDRINSGFSIWIDKKTDIWYLISFDINQNIFILSKADSGSNLERIQTLFPGHDFKNLKLNEYEDIDLFPGFYETINVLTVHDKNGLNTVGIGNFYAL